MNLKKLTLSQKALFTIVVILFPLTISFIHSYIETREQIKQHTLDDMTVVAEAYEGQVYQFLEMVKRRAQDFSTDGKIVSGLQKALKGDSGAARALASHMKSNKLPLDKSIDRISIITMEGRVLASTDASWTGRDVSSYAFFIKAAGGAAAIEESVSTAFPEIIAAAPVFGRGGGRLGVIAISQQLSDLSRVLTGDLNRELGAISWSKGKRKTMEAYIVNRDKFFITESKFIKDAVLKTRVDNESVRECLDSRKELSHFYKDYRGVEVAGASMCLPSMDWTLLLEVDSSEILAPMREVTKDAVVAALIAAGLIGLAFIAFYRNIISRLTALSAASLKIASGEYDFQVPARHGDEIGLLSQSFNRMSSDIKARTTLLKESEEKYRSLIVNIPDVTWTSDIAGRIVYVSGNVLDVMGYGPDEVCLNVSFWEKIIHPEDRARVLAAYHSLFETGARYDEQYRMMRKDGSWAWVYDRATSTYVKDGERLTDGVLTDITERKMSDLLRSITLYLKDTDSFDSAMSMVIDKVCELTGWNYGEVWLPRPDGSCMEHSLIWRGSAPEHDRFAEASKSIGILPGSGVPGRAWLEKKPIWVSDISENGDQFVRAEAAQEAGLKSAVGVPVIENGRALAVLVFLMSEHIRQDSRMMCFIEAIAAQLGSSLQRKLAEEARIEIQQRYEGILNSITVGVYRDTLSVDGRLLEVNRALVTMLDGDTDEDILSRSSADFYVDRVRRAEIAGKLSREGFIRGEEAELVTLKGRKIWVSISAVKKTGPDGSECVDGIFEDISERRRLEEQLRHAQKLEAVGQLAGGVAHDFNNILTAMIGYGHLLLMKKGEDETVRSYADHMLTLSEKAAHLTQSLLAFSRKQVMNPQPLELNGLIKRVEKILVRLIGEEVELRVSLAEKDINVKADPMQMEQVFMNLATNARDAMPDGGELVISSEVVEVGAEFVMAHGYGENGDYALITVSDSGGGMDDETRKRIFEPFFTTKEVGKGTGLGLSVVYGIVKQHNGYINVYSEPGMGSIFKIYLPIIEASEQTSEKEPQEGLRGGDETVLLAEDEKEVREVNRSVLEEFGYRVIEAVDGADAVMQFMENRYDIDILLIDLIMPKKNGREAYEEILRAKPDMKAIFLSGYAADMMRSRGLIGADTEFICKPVSPGELLKKVREALDR
jgi:PAS domain S-box-containing protein